MSECRFVPTYHAVHRYAQRVLMYEEPTADQMHAAAVRMLDEFTTATVVKRFANDPLRCRRRDERIAISRSGTHALLGDGGALVTIYEPGIRVHGCWCTWCLAASAPSTRRNTVPPKIPPDTHARQKKEN